MNILLLLAHSIEEYDQLKLLSGLGYDVFSIGGYINPAHPHDPKRPALPLVPYHPDLHKVVDDLGTDDNLKFAKLRIPDDIIDWADTIIAHHHVDQFWDDATQQSYPGWLVGNWDRIKHKRVIWRTVGQSVDGNERNMAPLRRDGLEIVRYSPKERNIPGYAGEDALIRFYKDPDEWHGWDGRYARVINITQNLRQREPYTNWSFWEEATKGLPRYALGPGSEAIGGLGQLPPDDMLWWLQTNRVYLYTGTQPASYTLGLIEAMMTGIPVVAIGPSWMRIFPYGHELFEGHELVKHSSDDPATARGWLSQLLNDPTYAAITSQNIRRRAIDLFGKDKIAAEWAAYLGAP